MTTERFRLEEQPPTSAEAGQPNGGPARETAPRTGGRLLIIDDERMARANLARALERGGHESAQAGSGGEEGLALLAEQDFDVVITDIAMAGINGMEVLKAVRSRKPEVEVIAGDRLSHDRKRRGGHASWGFSLPCSPIRWKKPACWWRAPSKSAACGSRWPRCAPSLRPADLCRRWWGCRQPCAACARRSCAPCPHRCGCAAARRDGNRQGAGRPHRMHARRASGREGAFWR